jgi:hypothetical protein
MHFMLLLQSNQRKRLLSGPTVVLKNVMMAQMIATMSLAWQFGTI